MSALASKLAAFVRSAKASPVRVHIHGKPSPTFSQRVVRTAAIFAAGAALMATQTYNHPEPTDGHRKGSAVTGVIEDRGVEGEWDILPDSDRQHLSYVQVKFGSKEVQVLDEGSRIRLVKQAAAKHELHKVGLNWKDLYGVIHAETAWVPRDGMGRNGVVSAGLAQLEPATAKALGVTDPHDPVQAIEATAELMKDGAIWARAKLSGLRMNPPLMAERLRHGVSIFYNLSTRGRNRWDGTNYFDMPLETQLHIENTAHGARIAARMDRTRSSPTPRQVESLKTAFHPAKSHMEPSNSEAIHPRERMR